MLGKDNKTQSSGVVSNKRSLKNRLLNWVRGNAFIPDPKVYWVKPSVKYLLNKIKQDKIEHVITTGPPHSMHLAGMKLKQDICVNWVAVFRDPLSNFFQNKFYLYNPDNLSKSFDMEKAKEGRFDSLATFHEIEVNNEAYIKVDPYV